uniref:Myeloperoxidase n=1 Tax=Homo sapiens TaxID=9606 RepID=A2NU82_HUMAN|nr:unnamed protein product [Homo sapiens]
MTAAGKGIREQ